MPIDINVKCKPEESLGGRIRVLLCQESSLQGLPDRNPLTETNFNALLDGIAQAAFDEGRRFENKHPNLSA